MIAVFHIVNIVLLLVCGGLSAYLVMLSILALVGRDRRVHLLPPEKTFAFIVPAYNEEIVIEKTLKSLLEVDYPREKFEVIVVADNCTDQTAEVAQRAGATVYERHDSTRRGKGYALRWIFDALLKDRSPFDAFIVIDADSTVSKNFLLVMNTYLRNGAQVIQSSDLVARQNSWSSEITRLGFVLYNYVRPLGRKVIGCSAGLRGNGMCFSAEVLKHNPWNAFSRTEDLEFGLRLLLHGVNIEFAPEATVLATMPVHSNNALTQRARWEGGRYPVLAHYGPQLVRAALRSRSFKYLDAFIDLVTPPLVNLMVFSLAVLLLNIVLVLIGLREGTLYIPWWVLVSWIVVSHVLIGIFAAGSDRSLFRVLLHVPQYAVWKIGLYARIVLFGRWKGWIRTTREAEQHTIS